jgi:hypothetical protein
MAKNKWDTPKDPADISDYWYDWTEFLPPGVTIVSQLVEGPDEINVVETDSNDTIVRARFGGGQAGGSYPMDCTVTIG